MTLKPANFYLYGTQIKQARHKAAPAFSHSAAFTNRAAR
ncbi:hypothetical protein ARMA_2853 [Ardenticatena maritima]|uniref:Uncharacterized protein n=1 Tax=Ardenticatena maritima TaxID=872965 RepID=A0A0M9UDX5_9CHLR|nr:hypothetical protein ARMA_2853 [Ardenticatena maritima]